jgi:TPR repeat protein
MANLKQWGLIPIAEIQAAADSGDAEAHNELGRLYSLGLRNLPQDFGIATKHFEMAVELGSVEAKWRFASGPELQTGAENGILEAQLGLGFSYSSGSHGLPVNQELAVKWWRRASEVASAEAQNQLGMHYELGSGLPQNYAEAAKWYHLAAEQGHHLAQFNLGKLYACGQGMNQDFHEAAKWNGKAAAQGYVNAQKVQSWLLAEVGKRNKPATSPFELSPSQKREKKLFTLAAIAIGVILLLVAEGNIFFAALLGLALLVSFAMIWGFGEALAEQYLKRLPSTKETLVGVGVFLVCLYFLDKGCSHRNPDEFNDPGDSWHVSPD